MIDLRRCSACQLMVDFGSPLVHPLPGQSLCATCMRVLPDHGHFPSSVGPFLPKLPIWPGAIIEWASPDMAAEPTYESNIVAAVLPGPVFTVGRGTHVQMDWVLAVHRPPRGTRFSLR